MKRIFTLLLSSLFSLSLLAADANRLSVSTINKNMDLTIEVDGRKVAMKNNAITLRNLSEGYHNVKIFAEKKKKGNGNAFGRKQDIIYSNSVFMKKGFHLDITVNRFGKVLVDERRMDRNDDWYSDDEDVFDDAYDIDYRIIMNGREFDQVKDALRKEWYETNRVKSAKFIIDQNNFSTAQVKELMYLFTFETNRLEIAKYAFGKTVDKKNYFLLNEALTMNYAKEDLTRYIREFR